MQGILWRRGRARNKNRQDSSPRSFILRGEITLSKWLYMLVAVHEGKYQLETTSVTLRKTGPEKPWLAPWRFSRPAVGPSRVRANRAAAWGSSGMRQDCSVVLGESGPAEQIQSVKLTKGMKGKFVVFLSGFCVNCNLSAYDPGWRL